jgi:hypothetical protein
MADRSARNDKEKRDRAELAEYRRIVGDRLSVAQPTPTVLDEHLEWTKRLSEFVNTIGLRRKPYFKEELPK